MCARYHLSTSAKRLLELFGAVFFEGRDVYTARYNIAPSSPVLIVREREVADGPGRGKRVRRELVHVRWGLVPGWADDIKVGYKIVNARSETAAVKPGYRGAMKYRRCIVPVSGFYEWKPPEVGLGSGRGRRTAGAKTPHHIRVEGAEAFGLAGLWESWQDPAGNELETCTVLTCEPNEMMADLHDRMPVILDPADYAAWLDPRQQEVGKVTHLLRPYSAAKMEAWPVSTYVNKTAHEGERCVAAVEPGDPGAGPMGQGGLFGA